MFGNVNEILYCMKLDCDCVVQVRHQMSQGRNANYILKRMKKDAATVVRASNEEICLLSCRYIAGKLFGTNGLFPSMTNSEKNP